MGDKGQAMIADFLRRLPLFAGLNDQDMQRLLDMAEPVTLQAGELLMEEGTPGDSAYIILEGEFEILKRSGQQDVVIALRGPGEVIGEISLLDQSPRTASVRAVRQSHLLRIGQEALQQLLASSPSATRAVLRTIIERLRNTELAVRQNEKMAALGTLAAGLAHELNNPAAAAQRSAAQMRDALAELQRRSAELHKLALEPWQVATVNALRGEMAQRATQPVSLDPLTRSDRESELQDWLEERGVAVAWELAPVLVSYGWDARSLAELCGDFSAEALHVVLSWLGAGYTVYALLEEVSKSAERISEVVKAVKTYSYLDQAPVQNVDVHEGLENTLIILKYKLKGGVQVTRDYASDLPRIEAYASELNQAWTNIIDNAIDATQGQGKLHLRTYRQGDDAVVVEITDNGPGIPPEIQPRIFEPFFTTKPPGVGNGLGLHITYNIIVNKHRGQIKVTSRPGETCFQVTLPIQLRRAS
jgi:signal transduction histidine kinase